MEGFINLYGFLGVWGLVTFPLYQAVLELSFSVFNFKKNPRSFKKDKDFSIIMSTSPFKSS